MAQVMGILLVEDRNTYTHTYGLSSIYHVSANDDLVMLARNHIGMKFSSWNISISVPEWSNCFFFNIMNMRTSMRFCPTSTRRNDNVITTSKRSRFDVIMTYFLRCVSAGCVYIQLYSPLHGYLSCRFLVSDSSVPNVKMVVMEWSV